MKEKVGVEGAGVRLGPHHHTKEPGQRHEIIEVFQQPVTCSWWCQGAVALGAAAWRTVKGVRNKLGGVCRDR